MKAAKAEGIAERTLQRACTKARVSIVREGFPSKTIWRLTIGDPPSPDAPVPPQSRQSRQLSERGATVATEAQLADQPLESDALSLAGAVSR